MRGLIEGYLNDYEASVRDYKEYVSREPSRWEGRTDYAWALIKTGNFAEAADVIDTGLRADPSNPWLLSMRATIFYEQGAYTDALAAARIAKSAVEGITEEMWLKAYPGNAPEVASTGIQTLREAARANLEKIERAASAHTRSE
jgi:predicted Zn-dependent protease